MKRLIIIILVIGCSAGFCFGQAAESEGIVANQPQTQAEPVAQAEIQANAPRHIHKYAQPNESLINKEYEDRLRRQVRINEDNFIRTLMRQDMREQVRLRVFDQNARQDYMRGLVRQKQDMRMAEDNFLRQAEREATRLKIDEQTTMRELDRADERMARDIKTSEENLRRDYKRQEEQAERDAAHQARQTLRESAQQLRSLR